MAANRSIGRSGVLSGVLFMCIIVYTSLSAQAFGQKANKSKNGPKGQLMIYGAFNYSKLSTPDGSSSSIGTSSDASIPVGVGYFINNNVVLGINYAFTSNRKNEQSYYKQQELGLWYSPSVMLGKYFALIGQLDVHYVWGNRHSDMEESLSKGDFNGYRVRAYPLFAVFLGKGWALKFKFAELSLLRTKDQTGSWSKSYVAGISGATFGAGISKNFDLGKLFK